MFDKVNDSHSQGALRKCIIFTFLNLILHEYIMSPPWLTTKIFRQSYEPPAKTGIEKTRKYYFMPNNQLCCIANTLILHLLITDTFIDTNLWTFTVSAFCFRHILDVLSKFVRLTNFIAALVEQ